MILELIPFKVNVYDRTELNKNDTLQQFLIKTWE